MQDALEEEFAAPEEALPMAQEASAAFIRSFADEVSAEFIRPLQEADSAELPQALAAEVFEASEFMAFAPRWLWFLSSLSEREHLSGLPQPCTEFVILTSRFFLIALVLPKEGFLYPTAAFCRGKTTILKTGLSFI